MSLGKYLTLDAKLIQQLALCAPSPPEFYCRILAVGITILEGKLNRESVDALSGSCSLDSSQILAIAQAASILFWECTKGAPKDDTAIRDSLMGMGLQPEISIAFCDTFRSNRQRLNHLKGALAISKMRYGDLTWRLDMEVCFNL